MNKPWWRWALFCIALDISWRTEWDWAGRLMSWCILPEWLASPEELAAMKEGAGKEESW